MKQKSKKPNNYGIPRSAKAIAKFKETVKNIAGFGKWNTGRFVSQRERDKVSKALKGKIPKNLSLLHSLPRTKQWKENIGNANRGKICSEATRRKISDAKRNLLTPLYKAIRECYKYDEWRRNIFKSNYFTCVLCGMKGGELNADHFPKRFVDIVNESKIKTVEEALNCKELWYIENGRTLCLKCHIQTETYGFKFKKIRSSK